LIFDLLVQQIVDARMPQRCLSQAGVIELSWWPKQNKDGIIISLISMLSVQKTFLLLTFKLRSQMDQMSRRMCCDFERSPRRLQTSIQFQ
jgi:hypothetical protein